MGAAADADLAFAFATVHPPRYDSSGNITKPVVRYHFRVVCASMGEVQQLAGAFFAGPKLINEMHGFSVVPLVLEAPTTTLEGDRAMPDTKLGKVIGLPSFFTQSMTIGYVCLALLMHMQQLGLLPAELRERIMYLTSRLQLQQAQQRNKV
jgi:hypothetical protein